jgi:cell division protein FtsA
MTSQPKKSFYAALDIGSNSICCMIAEPFATRGDARPGLKMLGFGQTASRGVRNGAVTDVEAAERAIRQAVDVSERMAERRVRDVIVTVSGGKPQCLYANAGVATGTGVVAPRDLDNAVAHAIASIDVGRRHVLHLMPAGFSVDGVPSDAPLGLHAAEISVELAVITVEPSILHNTALAVERAMLNITGYALSPYAAGRGALSTDEHELGALVIDLGGATSSFAIFKAQKLVSAGVLPAGSQLVTQDIAHGLSTTLAHAERMKTLFGSVLPQGHEDRELLAVPLAGEQGTDSVHKVPKHMLTAIVRPRMEEIFWMVRQLVEQDARFISPTTKIVLTGGGSQIHGLKELATEIFGLQARVAAPRSVQGIPDHVRNPSAAVVSGLLTSAAFPDRQFAMPEEAQEAIDRSQLTYAQRVGRWLKEAI